MSDEKEKAPGATLTEDQIRRRIEEGEIKRDELSVRERELYRDELQKGQFRTGLGSLKI